MDDSQKTIQSNPVGAFGQDPIAQSQPAVIQQPQQPQTPTPISIPHKEQIISSAPINSEAPLLTPTEQEPVVSDEVAHVVEKVFEGPQITEAHKQIGLELAKESVPVNTQPTGLVHVPWSPDEIQKVKRTTAPDDSKHWLAIFFERVLKQFSAAQKTAHT